MSPGLLPLVACFVAACSSGAMKVQKGEPQTAREKMLAEEKANKGDDADADPRPPGSKSWSGWRYHGERNDCFYVVGKKCFKTEKAACVAAKCNEPSRCESDGAGPATVTCTGSR